MIEYQVGCDETRLRAVFTVPVPGAKHVLMSYCTLREDPLAVVMVRAQQLLVLWRNWGDKQAFGNPSSWPAEEKYAPMAREFALSHSRPIELAFVSCECVTRPGRPASLFRKGQAATVVDQVAFINGITRTIWLLTQGCTAFPVRCELAAAERLHRLAAVEGSPLLTAPLLMETVKRGGGGSVPIGGCDYQ